MKNQDEVRAATSLNLIVSIHNTKRIQITLILILLLLIAIEARIDQQELLRDKAIIETNSYKHDSGARTTIIIYMRFYSKVLLA